MNPEPIQEVCHTPEECRAAYEAIPQELKQPAIDILKEVLGEIEADIRLAYEKQPDGWWRQPSPLWGMAIRNLLRSREMGPEYFGVHNLDDIYLFLIEDALKLR